MNFQFSERGHGTAVLVAFGLGTLFGLGTGLALLSDGYFDLGLFLILLGLFHLWEYIYVALFHPGELSVHSFLLPPSHSQSFTIAMGACFIEYFIESWWLFPSIKGIRLFVYLGFLGALAGQAIRTLAMYTAGSNFHHLIREEKEKDHQLVTFGIYQYLRHPSYFGWFWWSIAGQVVLMNPICIVGFAYASWRFFQERIEDEEESLIKIFGEDYDRFRARTPVGIPGIK